LEKKYITGKLCFVLAFLLVIPSIILAYFGKRIGSDALFMTTLLLMTVGSGLCTYKNSMASKSVACQMTVCSIIGCVFWSLNFFFRFFHISKQISFCGIFGFFMLLCSMYMWSSYYIKKIKKKKFSLDVIKMCLCENSDWLVIAILFVVLNMNIYELWIRSDGYIYYKGFFTNLGQWDFSLSSLDTLRMAGHLTAGYSFIWTIGAVIFGTSGLKVINMIMAVITIYCFKKILQQYAPDLNRISSALIQTIFAFAPLFFGISYEISADYPIFAYFVWFIYCWCYKKAILGFFMACLFCFTKESSPFFLFGFLLGEFVYYLIQIWKNRQIGIFKQIKDYFMQSYIFTAYAGILFVVSFLCSNTGWVEIGKKSITGESMTVIPEAVREVTGGIPTGFNFNLDYIGAKLNELFFMHFSWVILIAYIIIGIILLWLRLKSKIKDVNNQTIFPLLGAWISFILFNLLFVTYLNYRYIQLHWFFYVFFLGYITSRIQFKQKVFNIALTVIALLLLVESYITVDPVTYISFDKIDVGNIQVVTTKKYFGADNLLYTKDERDDDVRGEMLFDSLIHNRQYIALEKLTEEMFSSLNYNNNTQIILPPILNGKTEYTFRGYLGRPEFETYYWDEETNNITDNYRDIKINFVDYYSFIQIAKPGDFAYYLQYPYIVGFDEKAALENELVVEETIPFEKYGWTMNLLKIRKK